MSEPRTPQVPMVDGDGKPFYPLTQYNQIVMPDGNRWDGKGGGAQIDDVTPSSTNVYSSQKTQHELDQLSQQIGNCLTSDPAEDDATESPELGSVPNHADSADTAHNAEKLGGVDASGYILVPAYETDANAPSSNLIKINGASLNTPYTEGLTQAQEGLIISVNTGDADYNAQMSVMSGDSSIYIRSKNPGVWSRWARK